MIKNIFTITAQADGTIVLSDTPVFNKLESGVTQLIFELPMEGFAYLLARHDRRDYYAVPIIDNEIMMGQTVTQFDGRWAFNVCITETELKGLDRADSVVYMSDTFEGLVYDNIATAGAPSAVEPNTLKLANDCRYLYELFAAQQDRLKNDVTNVTNMEKQLRDALAKAAEDIKKAEDAAAVIESYVESAEASSQLAVESAEEAKMNANITDDNVTIANEYSMRAVSYAVGTNGEYREGDETDNAKYYLEQSRELLQETAEKIADTKFYVDIESGHLFYDSPSFEFRINEETGWLEFKDMEDGVSL